VKLAVSNIAWSEESDALIAGRLLSAGAVAIEVAPGRLGYPAIDAETSRQIWSARGLPIVSMQSLLFGIAGAALFDTEERRQNLVDALSSVIAYAGTLGCGPLVFGSPGNRVRGEISFAAALAIAAPVFNALGEQAAAAGCTLCIEANAPSYGCDFVTTLAEAATLVDAIDHPAVGMMVDTGNMALAGDKLADLDTVAGRIRHFHISVPQLAPVDEDADLARRVVELLRSHGYDGIATVEMRAVRGDEIDAVARAVEVVRGWIDG
jgi:sugar phosphate isomerase/epimerase